MAQDKNTSCVSSPKCVRGTTIILLIIIMMMSGRAVQLHSDLEWVTSDRPRPHFPHITCSHRVRQKRPVRQSQSRRLSYGSEFNPNMCLSINQWGLMVTLTSKQRNNRLLTDRLLVHSSATDASFTNQMLRERGGRAQQHLINLMSHSSSSCYSHLF